MAMVVDAQLPLAEVKNRLSQVVDQAESEYARVIITKHGRPAAVLLSADDLLSLEETLELLSDPGALEQIRASREELRTGEAVLPDEEQMRARIRH